LEVSDFLSSLTPFEALLKGIIAETLLRVYNMNKQMALQSVTKTSAKEARNSGKKEKTGENRWHCKV
jgi:hypothetical protein